MADVFISYAREDRRAAAALAKTLDAQGFSVWWDPQIKPHEQYAEVIDAQLRAARAVLVLWSKASWESPWVRSEAGEALELKKLVQARLDSARIPRPFDQFQAADLSDWRGEASHPACLAIAASLRELIRRAPDRRLLIGDAAPTRVWPDEPAPRRRGGGAVAAWTTALTLLAAGGAYLYATNPMIGDFMRYGGAVQVKVEVTVNRANVAKVEGDVETMIADNEALF